ncbi:tyrosine-type recombinase/integrase, partial [Marinibactrum halimedae]|uniref:tyrosine-type recombinase/integrase n=1 Tax=Marinibactrum halimedae TaxID=1444977 RepID=UPI0024E09E7C
MALKRKRTMHHRRDKVAIEHTGFYGYLLRYQETLLLRNYSALALKRRENTLRRFIGWCDERGLNDPQTITKPILESYQRYLYFYRQENGEPLSPTTRGRYISFIRHFFKWLTQENYLLYNPASELVIPKATASLPVVLSENEVARLMEQPDVNTAKGLRDRAILETFYSTGIRRAELCQLTVSDIALDRYTLFVKEGKGSKDRLLPIGP